MKEFFRRVQEVAGQLRQHDGFRRHLGNTSWLFADQALRMVAGLLVGIWVARYLGPEQFGVYAYVVMLVALFSPLAKLGLDDVIVRRLAENTEHQLQLLGTAFWIKIAGASLATALVVATSIVSSDSDSQAVYTAVVAAGLIFQAFEVIDFYFQSQVLSRYVSICRMAQLLLSSAIKVYLILVKAELVWFVFVLLLDQVMLALTLCLAFGFKHRKFFLNQFNPNLVKQLVMIGLPLMFNGLMVMLYMRIDQFMIGQLLGPRELGIYAAAIRLSEAVYVVPVVIASSVFPALVRSRLTSEALYLTRLKYVYALMLWSALIIAAITTMFANVIVDVSYGSTYLEAASILAIHVWTVVFVFIGVPFSKHLVINNQGFKLLKRTGIGMVLNLVLLYVLLPIFGAQGAAISAVICQGFVNFFGDIFDPSQHEQLRIKVLAFFKPFTPYFRA